MSVKDSDITLTNVEVVTDFKSAKVGLTSTATSGTIESGDKTFTRSAIGSVWEYEAVDYLRLEDDSSVTVEYSLDSGSTWSAITNLATANPSSGSIRFKATLTRTSTSILTPFFEIVRARYGTIDQENQRADSSYTYGPFIRILNTKPYRSLLKSEYGDYPNLSGMSFWTVGLSAFDSAITTGSEEEMLDNNLTIIEFLEGALTGKRFTVTNGKMADPGATVVMTQDFTLREVDSVGPRARVW
ncbi:hypothetical protein N8Z24_00720 [bacterium]|nr:hypothetical protein [bacterium]